MSDASWPARLRSQGLLVRWGVLCAVLLVLFPVVASVGWAQYGSMGLVSAAIALAIAGGGASVALALSNLSQGATGSGGPSPLLGVLAGMMFRMMLPLAAGAALHYRVPALRESGLLLSLAAFYLVSLPIETWLSLPAIAAKPGSQKPESRAAIATNLGASR